MGIRLDIVNDMSKAEEIKVLDKLRDAFMAHPDNYLASLFTNDFVGWCTNRIRDDFPLDAYEAMDWDNEKEELKREATDQKLAAEALNELLKEADARVDENMETFQTKISELKDLNNSLSEQLFSERNKSQRLMDASEAMELEIVKLKAKLYDLAEK
jgi:hypothetical protein